MQIMGWEEFPREKCVSQNTGKKHYGTFEGETGLVRLNYKRMIKGEVKVREDGRAGKGWTL